MKRYNNVIRTDNRFYSISDLWGILQHQREDRYSIINNKFESQAKKYFCTLDLAGIILKVLHEEI